jgi:hypothetical protein
MTVKFTKVLLALSMFFLPLAASAQNWQWAKGTGANAFDSANAVATDKSGNVIMTGYFTNFDVSFGSTTLQIVGAADIFIVKYDPNGNVHWAKSFGGSMNDKATAITTDTLGNSYITGYFASNTLTMGSTVLTRGTGGTHDMFVAKISPSGSVVWASNTGQASNDIYPSAIAVDSQGRVYVTGRYQGMQANFFVQTLTNLGGGPNTFDGFVVGLSAAGAITWARNMESVGNVNPTAITARKNGDFYVTGDFIGTSLSVGSYQVNNTNTSGTDAFAVKFDYFGNAQWLKKIGTNLNDYATGIVTDAAGKVYVTGSYYSTLTFGSSTIMSAGMADMFLAKYDEAGTEIWAKTAGGPGMEITGALAFGLSTAGANRLYATGSFGGSTMTFPGISTPLANSVSSNAFLASYDTAGTAQWAVDNNAGVANGIGAAGDRFGNAYMCGAFSGTNVTFTTTSTTTLTNSLAGITTDMFLARYGNAPTGIETLSALKAENIMVYPNPATEALNVAMGQSNYSQLNVYDNIGKLVYSQELNSSIQNISVDISKLAPGMYFLQTTGAEARGYATFVKQ